MFLVREISKAYHRREILRQVSFALPAGHCLGVEGENGSGKSTLLSILAQVNRPDSGDILYQDRSVMGDKAFLRGHLGYVPQSCDLLPDLTAAQQLRLWKAACGCGRPPAAVGSRCRKMWRKCCASGSWRRLKSEKCPAVCSGG